MKRSYIGLAMGALVTVAAFLAFPSCGFDRRLVSITINPPGAIIVGQGVTVNFQAIGNYIHPPDSRDITDSVVWASAATQVIDFAPNSNPGVFESGYSCGTNITITATWYSNPNQTGSVVVGTASVSVTPTPTQPPTC